MKTVLVVDDISEFLAETKRQLRDTFHVKICSSPTRAVRLVRKNPPDIVITTLVMKEMRGLEVIRRLRSELFSGPIVLVTRFGDASSAREATRVGANDYIVRPYPAEELISRIHRALQGSAAPASQPLNALKDGIQTSDSQMLALLELAQIAADTDARILILGETGTGKELFARAVHRRSPRHKRPFVALNCAALQENLLESELFGHEKGSFTGAHQRRVGRFEEANEGTLFLDEIGELSLALQAKLLRVLQSGEFSRVGGNAVLRSRARLIAATNQNLRERANEGLFRADLFFRLNVVSLTLPPLRERSGDIRLLAEHFLKQFSKSKAPVKRFSEGALACLEKYHWPGNIRELEHLVERCSILVRRAVIEKDDLPLCFEQSGSTQAFPGDQPKRVEHFSEARKQFEQSYFRNLLIATKWNFAEAARIAGMERTSFYRKAKRCLKEPP